MKKFLICLLTVLGLNTACGQGNFENADVNEFAELVADTNVVVLDVRTASEFAEGHLERAINIDYHQSDFMEKAKATLPLDKKIAVYCRSGRRSAGAAGKLGDEGYNLVNLKGGIIAWKEANMPVTAGSMTTGSVIVPDESYTPRRSDYTFRSEVRTITEDDEVRWDTIVVYLTDARGQTTNLYSQALPLDTINWNKGSIGEITEDDWNFDGIPDLQVCTGPMNGFGNYTYDVWLWDEQTHQFKPLDDISGIFDPYVDTDNKCIVSTWRLDDEVEIVRYKWKNGKLVESDREQMSYSDLTED